MGVEGGGVKCETDLWVTPGGSADGLQVCKVPPVVGGSTEMIPLQGYLLLLGQPQDSGSTSCYLPWSDHIHIIHKRSKSALISTSQGRWAQRCGQVAVQVFWRSIWVQGSSFTSYLCPGAKIHRPVLG